MATSTSDQAPLLAAMAAAAAALAAAAESGGGRLAGSGVRGLGAAVAVPEPEPAAEEEEEGPAAEQTMGAARGAEEVVLAMPGAADETAAEREDEGATRPEEEEVAAGPGVEVVPSMAAEGADGAAAGPPKRQNLGTSILRDSKFSQGPKSSCL